MNEDWKFSTLCVHAGVSADPSTGAIMTPIYQTSTYVQDGPGNHKGYEYGRTQNPTRSALEASMAALEGGVDAICFGSGLAATDAILKLLKPGDEILSVNDLYGGTYRLMRRIYEKFGIQSNFIAMTDPDAVAKAITPATKLIWIETPTNPVLSIVDIEAICTIAQSRGVLTCVDNTFASPYLQQPLKLGADFVVHSATKYLGGHSDAVHGVVVCAQQAHAEELHFIQNASGAVPGPMDCFLILRGIKTLPVRMNKACKNAKRIAKWLVEHDAVDKVYYPGLKHHINHHIAARQMKKFGAMISFSLKKDSIEAAHQVMAATRIFCCAESLGGVESLIGHPASMTHASIPREERIQSGLTDSLIRLSIGIEDAEDLMQDLEQALSTVHS